MAVISISDRPDDIWKVAGWAFRQALDDVVTHHPDDAEMAETFEQSKSHSGLPLDLLHPDFAMRIAEAILEVTTGILAGTIRSGIADQPYGDELTVQQYHQALKELKEIARRFIESRSA